MVVGVFVLLVGVAATVVVGPVGAGLIGLLWVVAAAVGLVAATLARADRAVLALAGASRVRRADQARYHNLVDGLCVSAGLIKPALYLVDDPSLNAFAVAGPGRSSVALTRGAVDQLSRIELEAVLAHELSHLKRGDALASTLAVGLLGWPAVAVDWARRGLLNRGRSGAGSRPRGVRAVLAAPLLLLVPLAPLFGRLVRLAVGREREVRADRGGVRLTRYPPGLVSALETIRAQGAMVASASPCNAHLWIAPPLGGRAASGRLVPSHPPTEARIIALKEL